MSPSSGRGWGRRSGAEYLGATAFAVSSDQAECRCWRQLRAKPVVDARFRANLSDVLVQRVPNLRPFGARIFGPTGRSPPHLGRSFDQDSSQSGVKHSTEGSPILAKLLGVPGGVAPHNMLMMGINRKIAEKWAPKGRNSTICRLAGADVGRKGRFARSSPHPADRVETSQIDFTTNIGADMSPERPPLNEFPID